MSWKNLSRLSSLSLLCRTTGCCQETTLTVSVPSFDPKTKPTSTRCSASRQKSASSAKESGKSPTSSWEIKTCFYALNDVQTRTLVHFLITYSWQIRERPLLRFKTLLVWPAIVILLTKANKLHYYVSTQAHVWSASIGQVSLVTTVTGRIVALVTIRCPLST